MDDVHAPVRRQDAGFTLLEMIVALVVFGLVMSGIAQTFSVGLVAWKQVRSNTTEPEELAALDAAFIQMIDQALPNTMTGLANQLSFTTRPPAGAALGDGLADVALIGNPNGPLVLRYRLHPPGRILKLSGEPKADVLVRQIGTMSVAYLLPSHDDQPARWSKKWSGQGLPLLIRLRIQPFSSCRSWPDLLAAPLTVR